MSLRSALPIGAPNTVILCIHLSNDLVKALNAVKQKTPSLLILQGDMLLSDATKIFQALNDITKREVEKKLILSTNEKLALDEYKLAIIEACRAALSQSSPIPFRSRKPLRTQLLELITRNANIKLKLVNNSLCDITLEQLDEECKAIRSCQNEKTLTTIEKELLESYFHSILDVPRYINSGRSRTLQEIERNRSAWKNFFRRCFFILPQLLQLLTNGCLYLVELLSPAQSLLTLIPGIPNPIVLGIACVLIVAAAIMEFAFGLQMFKDTYGISFFNQISIANLDVCEKQLEATKDTNNMLANLATCKQLNSDSYNQYTMITKELNKNINYKVGKTGSDYASYKENTGLKIARWGIFFLAPS